MLSMDANESTEYARRPSAAQQAELADGIALVTQLLLLDAVWTQQARIASEETGAEKARRVSELSSVVDPLDERLTRLTETCGRMEPIFNDQARTLRDGYVKAIEQTEGRRLTEDQRTKLIQVVDHAGGDFADAVVTATSRLRTAAVDERGSIRAEFDGLSRGATSEGDFSQEVETDLLWVAAGASVLLGPEAGVVVEAVAHLGELAVGLFHSIFG
jgi:hypothetical protein